MDAVTCPTCDRLFGLVGSFGGEDDDEDGLVTCPFCMRSFDPYAKREPSATASLDELFDLAGDDEDEEFED